jgi:uncharacterized SAM-binding protein YcdF (DUF218 family)
MDDLFFVASKLVWPLIRPETLFMALLGLSLFSSWRRRNRLARGSLGVAFTGLVILAIFPLGDLAFAPLEARYPANPEVGDVAGIIVLAGGEDADRSAAWEQFLLNEAGDRFLAAIALAHRFPKAKVLYAGGTARLLETRPQKTSVAEAFFIDAGISQDRVLFETRSRNTAENATFSLEIARKAGPGRWILVTSAFHMPRAMAAFCTAGWTNLIPWPTDYRSGAFLDGIGWNLADNLHDLNAGVKDWIGLLAYRLTGKINQIFSDGCRPS